MANVSRINGFRPLKYQSGKPYFGAVTMYQVDATDATALGIGDMVKLDGTASAAGIRGVTRATLSAPCIGAIVGGKTKPESSPCMERTAAKYLSPFPVQVCHTYFSSPSLSLNLILNFLAYACPKLFKEPFSRTFPFGIKV